MIYALLAAFAVTGTTAAMTYEAFSDDACTTPTSGGTVTVSKVTIMGTPVQGTSGTACLTASIDVGGTAYDLYVQMITACDAKTVIQSSCTADCAQCSTGGTITFTDGVPTSDGCSKATDSPSTGTKSVKIAGGFPAEFFVCSANPCFSRDTHATLADGESVLMTDLKAGDYVLPGPTRVIVNQHAKAAELRSSLLDITHSAGKLSLTPDHVLEVDGKMAAAREAIVGSKLGESEVECVTGSMGGIINPLTVSGEILADGVLSSVYPEWIAGYMLGRSTASAASLLSFLFPATTQAYYDAHLEKFFQSTSSTLASLNTLPAPVIALIFLVADLAVSAGLVAYTLASLKVVLAMGAIVSISQARK